MALKSNTAEGGTNGTAATTANTGGASGDAFGTVTPGAGGTINFASAQAMHGTLSYACSPASGVGNNLVMNDAAGGLVYTVMKYVYLTGYPSSETNWLKVQTTAGADIAYMNLTTAGKLKVSNTGGTLATFTNAIPLNTWTRVTFYGVVDASTGTINAKMYPGDSGTATETQSFTSQNTGTTAAGRVIYGKLTAAGTMATYYFDDIRQNLASGTELAVPTPAPTAAFTTATTGHTTAVDGTGSVAGGGSITSYAWTFGDGGSSSGATVNYRYVTPGTYTVQLTVTQTDGQTNSVTHSVSPVAGALDVKFAAITTGSTYFTPNSGSGNSGIETVIADSSLTTFASTDGSTAVSARVIKGYLAPIEPEPSSGQPLVCTLNADGLSGTSRTVGAKLYDYNGTTLVSTGQLVDATTGTLTGTTTIPVPLYTDTSDGGAVGTGNGVSGTVNRTILIGFPSSEIAAMTDSGWDKATVELTFNAS